jgi:hypothetical protein
VLSVVLYSRFRGDNPLPVEQPDEIDSFPDVVGATDRRTLETSS